MISHFHLVAFKIFLMFSSVWISLEVAELLGDIYIYILHHIDVFNHFLNILNISLYLLSFWYSHYTHACVLNGVPLFFEVLLILLHSFPSMIFGWHTIILSVKCAEAFFS